MRRFQKFLSSLSQDLWSLNSAGCLLWGEDSCKRLSCYFLLSMSYYTIIFGLTISVIYFCYFCLGPKQNTTKEFQSATGTLLA